MSFPDLTYCRLCAKQKPKDKLNDYQSKEREYNNNFKKLIRLNAVIDLSEETLPKTFCFVCIRLLEQAFEFVLQVEKAQELLRNVFLLQNVKTEEEPITSEENDNNVASEPDLCIKIETLDIPSSFIPLDDVSATPALKCEKKYRSYPCHVCDRRFNQSGHLAIHMRKHTGERPYPCDLCPKAFKVKVERDDHRRTHTGERPFACTVCPKTFTAAARLREHARTHTDQRPYPCDICGAAFRRPYARTVHTLIHTGEKPYECDICGTPFRRSGDLGKHKRTVHGMIRAILPTVPQTKKSRFYS